MTGGRSPSTAATAPADWRHSASAPRTAGRRSPTPCCCPCAPTDPPTACSSWAGSDGDAFPDNDTVLLEAFAEQAALALRVAQAQEDQGRLAVFEDRDRIGRDLHDLVIQRLFAIGLTLENVARITVRPEVAERIAGAVDDIDATIKDIRRTIFELSRAGPVDDLRAELADVVGAATPRPGLRRAAASPTARSTPWSRRGPPHLLAVVRETLSNAPGTRRRSVVAVRPRGHRRRGLTVTDDGTGFVDTGRRSGLRNMADRAESLGGTFEVRSPGRAAGRSPSGGCRSGH